MISAGERLPGTPDPMHRWPGAHGVTIAGDSWGNPSGPLVVLQHGGGQTRHAWKNVGETLGAVGYYAVAIDARGHGDSDWAPDGIYGQDVMVEDLSCVLKALGDRLPVLVGASMGGATSLVATGEGRVRAAALVLVDIAPRVEPEGVLKIQQFMDQRPDGFDTLEEVALAIAAYQPHREISLALGSPIHDPTPRNGQTPRAARGLRGGAGSTDIAGTRWFVGCAERSRCRGIFGAVYPK